MITSFHANTSLYACCMLHVQCSALKSQISQPWMTYNIFLSCWIWRYPSHSSGIWLTEAKTSRIYILHTHTSWQSAQPLLLADQWINISARPSSPSVLAWLEHKATASHCQYPATDISVLFNSLQSTISSTKHKTNLWMYATTVESAHQHTQTLFKPPVLRSKVLDARVCKV